MNPNSNLNNNLNSSELAIDAASINALIAAPTAGNLSPIALVHQATGPRTLRGKARSKNNAITHGIFSKVVVLPSESQSDFQALLVGLRSDLQPAGMLEELLVEKLAALFWRKRRLLIAEGAEIRAGSEFVEWNEKERHRREAAQLRQLTSNGGLVCQIANPEALQACVDQLQQLKEGIEENGFQLARDKVILAKLYGAYEHSQNWRSTLFSSYLNWLNTSLASKGVRQQQGWAAPQECRDHFLCELEKEVDRLRGYQKDREAIVSQRSALDALRHSVPEASRLDRLLKYEITLDRATDRVLTQLERLQRMRLGQPVPPPISLTVTGS